MSVKGRKLDVFQIVVVSICVLMGLIALYPMYYVLIMSISNPTEAAKGNVYFWPRGFYLGGYQTLLGSDTALLRSVLMSIFYAAGGTILMLITSVLGAYPLTRSGLAGRGYVIFFLLIPMYISGGMIPSFLVVQKLGIYNSVWAILLPGAYSISNIILVRTFFMSIPGEVAESALMDGANNYQLMCRIYVPLSKPVLAVVAIYTLVGIWNSWFNAMVYLPNINLHPAQMYLQRVLIAQQVDLTVLQNVQDMDDKAAILARATQARQLKYSMIVIVSLPILLVYPMFQKHFVKGVMLGSLKG